MLAALKTFVVGLLMGSADVVPGVSGGTIALVTGIYERLIASIRSGSSALGSLIKGDFAGMKRNLRDIEWAFLLLILGGILTAVLSLAKLIEVQLEENPVILAAAFFGLVLGSIVVASRMVRLPVLAHLLVVLVVGVAIFVLLGVGSDAVRSDPGLLAYFGSAALAICAMILPGISGSLILVLIGMYDSVLGAVNDRDLPAVAIFIAGAIVGLAFFSQILHVALRRWHDLVLAGLIGLMVGSLRTLWPWPDGVEGSGLSGPEGDLPGVLLAALVGFAVVLAIARLAPTDVEEESVQRVP
jgi:putative membrane protein